MTDIKKSDAITIEICADPTATEKAKLVCEAFAKEAIIAKADLLTNSSLRLEYSKIFSLKIFVFVKRFEQITIIKMI